MFCSKCGATVPEGVSFCPACGQPAGGAAAAMPPAPSPGIAAAYAASADARPPVYYAGFWLRFVAYLIDVVVIWIVLLPISAVLGAMFGLSMASIARNPDAASLGGSAVGVFLLLEGLAIVGVWLYYAFMESSGWQGTIGKKILGLRVTDLNGSRVSFGRASGRFFGKIVSGFTLLIGYIMAGFTEKKQALHDMIAGCLVVKSV
jgi:uncharacterized RDD family membrane protein YckC